VCASPSWRPSWSGPTLARSSPTTALSARRLAPLAALRATQRERLLETLHSWLLHWGSRAEVSADLFVHPQTVSYRLKHLRELLGDDLDNPAARFELLLVLGFRGNSAAAARPSS
jgi:DNA-binding PucR family transcriptional regulator